MALPDRYKTVIGRIHSNLEKLIVQVPWVLTHGDLSNMNMLVDRKSGHLTGIVDWAEATIEPFGIALWGLEGLLGVSNQHGWSYHANDVSNSRKLFRSVLFTGIGGAISEETRFAIEEFRILGLLLRYGFITGINEEKPTEDTTLLDIYIQSELKLWRNPVDFDP